MRANERESEREKSILDEITSFTLFDFHRVEYALKVQIELSRSNPAYVDLIYLTLSRVQSLRALLF